MTDWVLGVIGGSGLYDIPGLAQADWERIDSPFGAPSDELRRGRLRDVELVFLPRHGRGHRLPPERRQRPRQHRRAEARRLHRRPFALGGRLAARGLAPGDFVVVDQFIDRTFAREKSFFGPGLVGPRLAWPTRSVRACPASPPTPAAPPAPVSSRAAATWRWKARSSPPGPRASSTAPGAAT